MSLADSNRDVELVQIIKPEVVRLTALTETLLHSKNYSTHLKPAVNDQEK